jgi:hypothetical protein
MFGDGNTACSEEPGAVSGTTEVCEYVGAVCTGPSLRREAASWGSNASEEIAELVSWRKKGGRRERTVIARGARVGLRMSLRTAA